MILFLGSRCANLHCLCAKTQISCTGLCACWEDGCLSRWTVTEHGDDSDSSTSEDESDLCENED